VSRPEGAEVAVVECGQLRLIQALHHGEDGGVDEADVCIGILVTEFADAPIVLGIQALDSVGASENVIEQSDEDAGVEPRLDPVIDLHENRGGNNKRLVHGFDQATASRMADVAAVE
jgi:hypothetical protein